MTDLLSRGEVWMAQLDPVSGHEQGGTRPVLIISSDALNHGPATLAIVAPITSRARQLASQVQVEPPEGGLTLTSFIMCDHLRSVSHGRLLRRLGRVSPATLRQVEDRLTMLLDLWPQLR